MARTPRFQWSALRAALAPSAADATGVSRTLEAGKRAAVALRTVSNIIINARSTSSSSQWPGKNPLRHSSCLSGPLHHVLQHRRAAVAPLNDTNGPLPGLRKPLHMSSNSDGRKEGSPLPLGPEDLPPFAHRVFEAAEDTAIARGKDFWTALREEASRCIEHKELPPYVLAPLMAAFTRGGELTAPLATMAANRFVAALREWKRRAAVPLLLQECGPEHEEALDVTRGTKPPIDFSAVATLLVAMRDSGLLEDACVKLAAQALQDELLLCMQHQWEALTFGQMRRLLLLLGATAEKLNIQMTTARELFRLTKKFLRKMQKKGHLVEGGDARDSIALLWPLANISISMELPHPQKSSDHSYNSRKFICIGTSGSSRGELDALCLDRDILLHLLKTDVFTALSSRLPCRPFDLALGFIGLERLGQEHAADYALAAFAAAAGAASGGELCRLGRELLLTGAPQKDLWDAFAHAAANALQQQTLVGEEQSVNQRIAAELSQWLRFCGHHS